MSYTADGGLTIIEVWRGVELLLLRHSKLLAEVGASEAATNGASWD